MSLESTCLFRLFFQMAVPNDLQQYVKLESTSIEIKKDLALMQFILVRSDFETRDNGSAVEVTFLFQRRIMYHLWNTYLPTVSLLAIVEMTLLFDESKQDMAVTLSLTVLLVMYTFYQSLSESIPKTSYIKLIDIWLIFCLLVPFATFLVESACYLESNKRSAKVSIIKKRVNLFSYTKLFKFAVISLTLSFITFYFCYCLHVFVNP